MTIRLTWTLLIHALYYQTPYQYSFSCFGSQIVADSKGAWRSGSITNGSGYVLSWVLAYMFGWPYMFVLIFLLHSLT